MQKRQELGVLDVCLVEANVVFNVNIVYLTAVFTSYYSA